MNFPEMQHKYYDICLEVEKKCKQVIFSNYPPFTIVYNLVQFMSKSSVIQLLAQRPSLTLVTQQDY